MDFVSDQSSPVDWDRFLQSCVRDRDEFCRVLHRLRGWRRKRLIGFRIAREIAIDLSLSKKLRQDALEVAKSEKAELVSIRKDFHEVKIMIQKINGYLKMAAASSQYFQA